MLAVWKHDEEFRGINCVVVDSSCSFIAKICSLYGMDDTAFPNWLHLLITSLNTDGSTSGRIPS